MIDTRYTHSGAMLLISILAVGVVSLGIVFSSAVRLMGELHAGEGDIESHEAFVAAESCIQESLLRLTRDSGFSGVTLSIGNASCTSVITSEGGVRRRILATGTRNRWSRRITMRADMVSPKPIILEWKEW